MPSDENSAELTALETELHRIISPEAAFIKAADTSGRHDPGLAATAEFSTHVWFWLSSGFAAAILAEFTHGVAKAVGEDLGHALTERLKGWTSRKDPKTSNKAETRELLQEADALMQEASSKLDKADCLHALEAGRVEVRTQLEQRYFPPSRAKRLASAVRDLARERLHV
jgi:hypothetical protein